MPTTITVFESSVTASTSYTPDLGDISTATYANASVTAWGNVDLSTASNGWSEVGAEAECRHQTNPVSGATVKAVQYQFATDDPANADPLVITSTVSTNFAGHLLTIS